MDIQEGNKLIAEFMGVKTVNNICERCGHDVTETPYCSDRYPRSHALGGIVVDLKYHSSWSWLMPVVEKIENLDNGITVSIFLRFTCIKGEGEEPPYIAIRDDKSKIENCWQAVIQFIQWYNSSQVK